MPIPEVFGWAEDGEQRFIYMALIEGDTLQRRWGGMAEEERLAVCAGLKDMVKVWRGLEQDENEQYIGRVPLSTTIREQTLTDTRQVAWANDRWTISFSTAIQKTTNQNIADHSKAQMPFASFKTLADSLLIIQTRLLSPTMI